MSASLDEDPVECCPHCHRPTPVRRPEWLTLDGAAVYVGLSTRTLRRRIAQGAIEASKLDLPESRAHGQLRIRVSDLDALMRPIPTTHGDGRRTA